MEKHALSYMDNDNDDVDDDNDDDECDGHADLDHLCVTY